MNKKLQTESPVEQFFYLSPTQKVHSQNCRYCQPNKDGWLRLESFEIVLIKGYQTCRLCCPVLSDNQTKQDSNLQEVKPNANSQTVADNLPASNATQSQENLTDTNETSQSNEIKEVKVITKPLKSDKQNQDSFEDKNKNYTEKAEKKRYKILAGNGAHQAIAEIQAMLMKPSQEGDKFKLILPDGFQIDATFKNPRLKWLAYNNDSIIGLHWFRGYPKMNDGKLVCFQIVAWDGDMPTSPQGFEKWEFIGLWTPQKNLTVQRSMGMKEIRTAAKETGFIKKFKFTFTNSQEWVASKKLWIGYVYKLICRREGDTLKIQKVIPFACPRLKPVNKGKGDFKR